jgi:hypothetical protein
LKLNQSFVPVDNAKHLVKVFDCGKPDMNLFLSRFAVKHAKLGLSRTLVLPVDEPEAKKLKIAAYYTLAASTITRKDIPATNSLPRYPIPVAMLARLAVDIGFQGENLGAKSLIYALRHSVRLCDEGLPVLGLVLDVLDSDALAFYQRFDFFSEFSNDPMRLFVSMTALRKLC